MANIIMVLMLIALIVGGVAITTYMNPVIAQSNNAQNNNNTSDENGVLTRKRLMTHEQNCSQECYRENVQQREQLQLGKNNENNNQEETGKFRHQIQNRFCHQINY